MQFPFSHMTAEYVNYSFSFCSVLKKWDVPETGILLWPSSWLLFYSSETSYGNVSIVAASFYFARLFIVNEIWGEILVVGILRRQCGLFITTIPWINSHKYIILIFFFFLLMVYISGWSAKENWWVVYFCRLILITMKMSGRG